MEIDLASGASSAHGGIGGGRQHDGVDSGISLDGMGLGVDATQIEPTISDPNTVANTMAVQQTSGLTNKSSSIMGIDLSELAGGQTSTGGRTIEVPEGIITDEELPPQPNSARGIRIKHSV